MKKKHALLILAAGVLSYMAFQMLFGELDVTASYKYPPDFSLHVHPISLQTRVADKAGRSIFWFNADRGPSPRSVELLPNGDVKVIFPSENTR